MTPTKDEKKLEELPWALFHDGSSNGTRCGAWILLESAHGVVLEQALTIAFPFTKNQTKYEAYLAGLEIAADIEVQVLKVFSDSKLMVNQSNVEYWVKELILKRYVKKIREIKERFKKLVCAYIPREENTRADILSKPSNIKEHRGMGNVICQYTLQDLSWW